MMDSGYGRTGTSALTPMSGASAALRIQPVAESAMPPMMAAPSARSAHRGDVVASRSNLGARRHGRGAPLASMAT